MEPGCRLSKGWEVEVELIRVGDTSMNKPDIIYDAEHERAIRFGILPEEDVLAWEEIEAGRYHASPDQGQFPRPGAWLNVRFAARSGPAMRKPSRVNQGSRWATFTLSRTPPARSAAACATTSSCTPSDENRQGQERLHPGRGAGS